MPKQPAQYQTIDNVVDYFIANKREAIWNKNQHKWKEAFRFQLLLLDTYINHNASQNLMNSFMYRLALGYWGIQTQNGIPSGVCTENSINLASSMTTGDHIFGAVEIGKCVHEAFISHNRNIDYMVNTWLYENIWLWITIKVTKQEHKSENIIKNGHSIEEKKILKHYVQVSKLMAKL